MKEEVMKRILAIILVLMMILPLAVACDSDADQSTKPTQITKPTGNGTASDELSKLAGKTPKELYDSTISALGVMTEYEIMLKDSSTVHLMDEPAVSTSSEEYKIKNGAAYIKYVNPAEQISEIWFKDGVIYTSSNDEKQRTNMTAEAFASSYLLNISTIIFPLSESYFKDMKFSKDGDNYALEFAVTKEDYLKYLSIEITGNAQYDIIFDSKGVIKSAKMSAICSASAGVSIELVTEILFNKLGEAADITVAGKPEDYRLAPATDAIDMTPVDSLDKFSASEEPTDYVMIEVEGKGTMVVRLFENVAPVTVANFKALVAKGFYDGMTFHRIVKDFVIQAGDVYADGSASLDEAKIRGEFAANGFMNNLPHVRGVISMARTSQDMNSASTQFFIMEKDNAGLDGQYGAFGFVVYGLDVIDAIAAVEVDESEKPTTNVVIKSAKFVTLNK
jgi:peptidyl-prolyl cis-trans isomerase B (cyclophilin B)